MTKKRKQRKRGTLENKENLTFRVPRPLGLTLQMRLHHKQQGNEEELKRIKIRLIEQWTSGNMMLNERIYTVEQLSQYLNESPSMINKYMWKAMGKIGKIIEKKDAGEIAREIFGTALKKSTEISALIASQAAILMKSQGGKYVPFVSSSVNQALANLNATQAPILALLKVITDKQEVNLIVNQNNQTVINQHITAEEALKIANGTTKSLLEDDKMVDQKALEFSQYGTLPDTNPRTQNTQFLSLPKLEKGTESHINPLPITTHPEVHNPSPIPSHEDRRQAFEEVMDEEDFNM